MRCIQPWPFLLAGCVGAQGLDLPQRSTHALAGTELLPVIASLSVAERESVLWEEVVAGNVPAFLRRFVPVTVRRADARGRLRSVVFEVAPDVVSIGSDQDFFRVPLTPTLGQRIADRLDCTLPTRRMVDDIWRAATVRLDPVTFSPTQFNIVSPALFYRHHQRIEQQRGGAALGALVSGIKKDVVITPRLAGVTDRVAIYGWHRPTGVPIQPLYTGHVDFYADYSHGLRLVRQRITVDGAPTSVATVLADPVLHPLLSDEGAFTNLRYPTPQTAAAETFPLIDAFPAGGAELASWRPKFTAPRIVPLRSPRGEGSAIEVMDPAGGTDTLRLGHPSTRDQVAQADLFCDYRPALAGTQGFERVGVFVRDRARGAFDGTFSQRGACYALTWDSGDGRLSCLRVANGVLRDLAPQPIFLPSTAWRRLRLEARGAELTFVVDGAVVLTVVDSTHPSGEFGLGHHEFFGDNRFARGALADNWFADVPQGFRLRFDVTSAGVLGVDVARGVPGDLYLTAMTLARRGFPQGWFFGLDPTLPELSGLLSAAHPAFLGRLDAGGRSRSILASLPRGLEVFGVSLDIDGLLPPIAVSPPVTAMLR